MHRIFLVMDCQDPCGAVWQECHGQSRVRAVRGCCCRFPDEQAGNSQSKSGAEGCRQSSRRPVLISVLLRLQLVHCNLVNICGCDLQRKILCVSRAVSCLPQALRVTAIPDQHCQGRPMATPSSIAQVHPDKAS